MRESRVHGCFDQEPNYQAIIEVRKKYKHDVVCLASDFHFCRICRRFVKNLASNQINLSTLKGEGELSSINLDETALEDVIELPTWLKIQKATCGRVFIKVWNNVE